jgi:hypothetical protein
VQEALNAAEETETITVDDFPGFVSDNTRVGGEPTEKTAWEEDDVIFIKVDGAEKYATLTYNATDSKWEASDNLSIKSGQSYEATYAPNYTLNEGQTELVLKDGAAASTGEYLTCTGKRPIRIKFSRQYSRLRIYCGTQDATDATDATAAATPITVTFGTGFTTNDGSSSTTFSLTPDKGNAYVYGSWKEGTKLDLLSVVSGDPSTVSYIGIPSPSQTIASASKSNKSYAMEMTVGKEEKWYIYNLDKATTTNKSWSGITEANCSTIKVIGTWSETKSLSFTNATYGSVKLDLSDVRSLSTLPEYFCSFATFSEITLPTSDLTTIGKAAFLYCFINSMEIPASVTTIEEYGFNGCQATTYICNATNPPTLADNAFAGTYDKVLYVPYGTVDAYKNSSWLSDFGEDYIRPISELNK